MFFRKKKKKGFSGGLKEGAERERKRRFSPPSQTLRRTRRYYRLPDVPTTDSALEAFNYFMKTGIDFKGQVNSAYDTRGKAVTGRVSVDVGEIFIPGTTCSVGGSIKAEKARHTMLIITRQQDYDAGRKANPTPICFNCMVGSHAGLSVSVEAEAGFKTPEIPGGKLGAECISYTLEAKAVATGSASYKGTYMHIYDPAPRWYGTDEIRRLREDFTNMLNDSRQQKALKTEVLAWFDSNVNLAKFKPKYRGIRFGMVSTRRLIGALENVKKERGFDLALCREANLWIAKLSPYLKEYPFREFASLKLWGHEGEASAGVEATAEAGISISQDGVGRVGTGVSAKVGGPSATGRIKKTIYRYQNYSSAENPVVMTQDTTITYKQLNGEWFSASFGASATVGVLGSGEGTFNGFERGAEFEKEVSVSWEALNSMSYISAVAYWLPPSSRSSRPVYSLPGSGYSYGHSVVIENLRNYYLHPDAKAVKSYIDCLAAALRVKPPELKKFLDSCRDLVSALDEKQNPGLDMEAVLVESSFAVSRTLLNLNFHKKIEGRCSLKKFRKKMMSSRGSLQAIRLRYRIRDAVDSSSNLFSLGFTVLGSGVGIELEKVTRAGSEGIVDLYVHWFGALSTYNSGTKSKEAYEKAVPPVALLHQ